MTNLYDIVDPNDLAAGIKDKLINLRTAYDNQQIYNYSDAAMFTPGAWENPAVRACRGLIVDQENKVIARPWAKFFNHNQSEAGSLDLDASVEVTDKMDGSLGIIHYDNYGQLRVATRGSFESDQALWATDWLRLRLEPWDLQYLGIYTPLVEIIYPENRIVCDYGDTKELVLLGAVETATGKYIGPGEASDLINWPYEVTQTLGKMTVREALEIPPREGKEGLCLRFLDESKIVKIKQEDYVQLHKIVTGLNERTVWEHAMEAKPLEDLLAPLPDELHDWTRDVWNRLGVEVQEIENRVIQAHFDIVARLRPEQRGDRKAYALYAKKNRDLAGYLFSFLDGKNIRPLILKNIKPSGATKAVVRSEDVA